MNRRGLVIVSMLVAAALGLGTVAALASDSSAPAGTEILDADDAAEGPDVPITGAALEQASEAALAYVGEGSVTGTEVGDEESYYEVEVTLDDGSEIDVQLDEGFVVVGTD